MFCFPAEALSARRRALKSTSASPRLRVEMKLLSLHKYILEKRRRHSGEPTSSTMSRNVPTGLEPRTETDETP